jgi:hypothetical protein
MWLLSLPTAFFALTSVVYCAALEKHDLLQELQHKAIEALKRAESNGTITNSTGCSVSNAAVRKDW